MPSVPLASQIESDLKKIAAKHNRLDEPPPKSTPIDSYSHWFQRAFPQAKQRQRYFRNLVQDKPITHANLRLAHLLGNKRLATLLVTPNFDDFVSKGLTLFGHEHIVCDHPATAERINPESDDIQILHVHGTYWFYDACNLRGEIEDRAQDRPSQAVTMTSLLGDVLSRHSPLVLGYAGWEDDVIMTALKRRLQSGLGHNLYWFLYRRSNLDTIPAWVRQHRNVYLVLPPDHGLPGTRSHAVTRSGFGVTPDDQEPFLSAQRVLDELVRAFDLQAPHLTRDPIGFFAERLRRSFPIEPLEEPGEDIYFLSTLIRRVDEIRDAVKDLPELEAQVEVVRDAVRRSAYNEALEMAGLLAPRLVTPPQREELMISVFSAASGLGNDSEAELAGYELILRFMGERTEGRLVARRLVATTLCYKALTLSAMNRNDEAIENYTHVVRRFADDIDMHQRETTARALFNKAKLLGDLGRIEDAIQTYEEVVQRFGEAREPELREATARSLSNKAFLLGETGKREEAIQLYYQVVQRFKDATEAKIRVQVAKGLFSVGVMLGELARDQEAIEIYDQLARQMGEATEPEVREQVVMALFNKGVKFGNLDRYEEAIQVYDQLVERFGDATETFPRHEAAKALMNKGIALGKLNRSEEEIQTYEQTAQRFGNDPEVVIRECAARALIYKAQRLYERNRIEEATRAYDQIVQRFGDTSEDELNPHVAKAIHNKGAFLKESGRSADAALLFQEVVRRFDGLPNETLVEVVNSAKAELEVSQR